MLTLLAFLLWLLAFLFVWIAYRVVYTAFFSDLLKIPGLPYGPLYGNIRESMEGEAMDASVRWVRKYGGILRYYHFLGAERVLVSDPELIKEVLVTKSTIYPRSFTRAVNYLVPEGLIATEGEVHRSARKLLNPALSLTAVAECLPLYESKALELNGKLRCDMQQNSGRVNIQNYVKCATFDVISVSAFGEDIGALADPDNEIVKAFGYMILAQRRSLKSELPFYKYFPSEERLKMAKAEQVVNDYCLRTIKKHKQSISSERNIMTRLIDARFEDGVTGLSDEALRDQMVTFMIAGHETSSFTLTWLLFELAKHPDVQVKLADEVSTISSQSLTIDTLDSMKYLDACVKETLRLYPPATSITRKAKARNTLGGYNIPAGTTVILHLGAMMRTSVENGLSFIPERFLQEDNSKFKWLPFGIGPHTCIGNKFAMVEMKVLLYHIIRRFKLKLVDGLTIHRKYFLTMRPYPDVELILTER